MSDSADSPATDTAIGTAAGEGTEFLPDAIRNAPTPAAWSQADDDDPVDNPPTVAGASRGRSWIWAIGIAAAAVSIGIATAMGIVASNHRHSASTPTIGQPSKTLAPQSEAAQPIPAPPTSQPPAVVAAPALDGTYEMPLSPSYSMWYGFRSTCTPAGCTAAGIRLADHNHYTVYASRGEAYGDPLFLRWDDGHWQGGFGSTFGCVYPGWDSPNVSRPLSPPQETDSELLSLEPQPGGAYRGTLTITVVKADTMCTSKAGDVDVQPLTATRTGPPPVGLVADPPTG